jgi:hypothetical protein
MAKKKTESYFAKLLKKIPLVNKGVKSIQDYYFQQGLQGKPMGTLPRVQQRISQINPRPIDFSPSVSKIKNPVLRVPAQFATTAASEMLNVPSRLAHYGYRAGQANTPQQLIGATSGVAGALADIPLTGTAFNLARQATKNVGKKTISEILKESAKQGAKSGAVLGGLYGLEEGIDAPDLKSQALSGLMGTGTGTVLGAGAGATLAGLGIAGKSAKDFVKYLQDPNFKPPKSNLIPNAVNLESSVSIGDILKKRSTKQMDFSTAKKELVSTFKGAKNFDASKLGSALDVLEKKLGSEKLAELQYKSTTGEGLNFGEFWRQARGELKKTRKGFLKEADISLLKYVDEQIGQQPKVVKAPLSDIPVIPKKPLAKQIEEKVVETANKKFTSIDNYTSIDKLIKKANDPVSNLKRTVNYNVRNKADVSKVFIETEANLINLGRNIQEKLAKKGITNDEFVAKYEALDYKGIEAEAKLKDQVNDIIYKINPEGEGIGKIKKGYIHRFSKDAGLKLEEMFPNVYFDAVDARTGYKLTRTGKKTKYETDIPTELAQLGKETLYNKYKDFFEADRTGQSVFKIRAKRELVESLLDQIERDRIPGKDYSLTNMARKMVVKAAKQEGKKPPRIKVVKGKLGLIQMLFDTNEESLRAGGVFEVFEPLRNAKRTANEIYLNQVAPLLDSKNQAPLFNKLNELGLDASYYLRMLAAEEITPQQFNALISNQLYQRTKGEALDQAIEFLATHRFESNNLQSIAEWVVQREIAMDVVPKTFVKEAMRGVRTTYYRGALGFNARPGVNNLFEAKRAFAVGNIKDFPEAMRKALSVEYRKKMKLKWGIEIQNSKELMDYYSQRKSSFAPMEKFDDKAFAIFNQSEEIKDVILLTVLEKDGVRKGYTDEVLTKYVLDGFHKFAHKYGTFGTVGMFNNDYVKTFFQFGQYPIKELGLYLKQGNKAAKGIGAILKGGKADVKQIEAMRYLTKVGFANAAIIAVAGYLYGATAEEIFGAMPFNIDSQGISPHVSPAIQLVQNVYAAAKDYQENIEEGSDKVLSDSVKKNLSKSMALLVPGGNQLINKTGIQAYIPGLNKIFPQGAIGDQLRGYNESASGLVRFKAADNLPEQLLSGIMGPFSTENAREYFDKDRRPLGEKQGEDFKTLWELGDKEGARQVYDEVMATRDKERAEKKMFEAMESGTYTGNPADYEEGRKQSILEIISQGFTKPKEIKQVLADVEPTSSAYSTSEINEVLKEQEALTIQDVLARKSATSEKDSIIKKVMESDSPLAKLSEEQKMQYLQSKGVTQEDIQGYYMRALSSVKPKDKADYIISNGIVDFTGLYKEGAIQFDDLKELQRRGYIPDADDLWEKLKMTDIYYRQEAEKKVKDKYIKDLIKQKYKIKDDMREQQLKTIKQLLKAVSSIDTSLPKRTYKNYAASLRKRL